MQQLGLRKEDRGGGLLPNVDYVIVLVAVLLAVRCSRLLFGLCLLFTVGLFFGGYRTHQQGHIVTSHVETY